MKLSTARVSVSGLENLAKGGPFLLTAKADRIDDSRFACERGTPLGRPVVPEVNASSAVADPRTSVGSIASPVASASARLGPESSSNATTGVVPA